MLQRQRQRTGTSSSIHNPDGDADGAEDGEVCAFCLEQIRNPVKLRCSHTFCKGCLQKYREARGWVAERCPLCRRRLDDYVARNWMAPGDLLLAASLLVDRREKRSASPEDVQTIQN
ncbi:E3 ubiquitin-protein ligase RNF146-B isoform X1 [Drosophila persimilis]|uniref:E3 ubiquitin-protein ligase RNF146-B isoform X1 n=1 Tax=Drosophila persimilis TaxID=7234 RepID=UPI000F097A98|nr:E3 ubiquitin-protein ligase RNF146-B isoform X1 [Drosophila persimilis]